MCSLGRPRLSLSSPGYLLLICCSFAIDVYVNVWYFHNVFRFVWDFVVFCVFGWNFNAAAGNAVAPAEAAGATLWVDVCAYCCCCGGSGCCCCGGSGCCCCCSAYWIMSSHWFNFQWYNWFDTFNPFLSIQKATLHLSRLVIGSLDM